MIKKVPDATVGLPPLWMTRVIATTGNVGNTVEIKKKFRKLLGEPKPQELDLDSVPPERTLSPASLRTSGGTSFLICRRRPSWTI
jgi:hypothetical protein